MSEPTTALVVHGLGCRCWPHVSQREATEAVIQAARAEYAETKRLRAESVATIERLREALDRSRWQSVAGYGSCWCRVNAAKPKEHNALCQSLNAVLASAAATAGASHE